LARISEGL
jgi:dynein heavy chain 1